ncbi:DUF881 domain-containing protein [Candidatus Peregrinibacteria bacterium]|nr:DUF881 domain-containing protein [Candidatus Peregrinibacteria bacterium]
MKKTVFITIAVVLGILLSLQIRSFKRLESFIERSKPADVLAELRTFQVANEQLRVRVSEESKAVSDLESNEQRVSVEDEIKRLDLLAGTRSIAGEGVLLTFTEVPEEFWMSDLVTQLISAGAEAIAVGDTQNVIRLTSRTAGFRSVGGGLMMRRYFLKPPFHVIAIGSKSELRKSVAQEGGIVDRITSAHPQLKITVQVLDRITIPALKD